MWHHPTHAQSLVERGGGGGGGTSVVYTVVPLNVCTRINVSTENDKERNKEKRKKKRWAVRPAIVLVAVMQSSRLNSRVVLLMEFVCICTYFQFGRAVCRCSCCLPQCRVKLLRLLDKTNMVLNVHRNHKAYR